MKSFIKWSLIILSILGVLLAIWYFYFFNRHMTLQADDKETIEKSFLPDSDGKGYSDLAQKNIAFSLEILKNEAGFTNEELENVKYFNILQAKLLRKAILAKNREEFVPIYIRFSETHSCLSQALIQVRDYPNSTYFKLKASGFDESKLTLEYFDVLIDKYLAFYDFKTMNKIRNSSLKYEQCLKVKIDKTYE